RTGYCFPQLLLSFSPEGTCSVRQRSSGVILAKAFYDIFRGDQAQWHAHSWHGSSSRVIQVADFRGNILPPEECRLRQGMRRSNGPTLPGIKSFDKVSWADGLGNDYPRGQLFDSSPLGNQLNRLVCDFLHPCILLVRLPRVTMYLRCHVGIPVTKLRISRGGNEHKEIFISLWRDIFICS